MLLKLIAEHNVAGEKFVTCEFSFVQMLGAYDVFANAANQDSLKALIHSSESNGGGMTESRCRLSRSTVVRVILSEESSSRTYAPRL